MPKTSAYSDTATSMNEGINGRVTAAEAPGLSIGQILQMLAKHKGFIIGCTLACALVAFVYDEVAKPIYEATATVRIDESRASSLGLNGNLNGDSSQPATDSLTTDIQILQSDAVAIAAIDALSPEDFRRFAHADKSTLLIPATGETLTAAQEDLISNFKVHLAVKQVLETQLVTIAFRDPDPRLAATMVNHVVAAYLRKNFDSRFDSVTQVNTWLSGQMQSLRAKAAEAQAKLAAFQEHNDILVTADSPSGTNAGTTTSDRLRLLNEALVAAEGTRIIKEAQLKAATAGNPSPAVLAALYPDPKLQVLQTQQGTLFTQYAQLSTKFGPKYAPLAEVKRQLAEVDAEVDRNAKAIRGRLKEEYDTANKNESMLRGEYDEQVKKAYSQNRQQAELAALEAEGTASRQLYNTLQYKLDQAGVDVELSALDTQPVDIARAPIYPAWPKKFLLLALGTVLGLLIGIASALIIETSSAKVSLLPPLQILTGFEPLVMIPRVGKHGPADDGLLWASTIVLQQPSSQAADSYRMLRNLLVHSHAETAKMVAFTSAEAGEGKSTVASNYALVLAQTGAKVLLVDAELRQPSLQHVFALQQQQGLAEAVSTDVMPKFLKPVTTLPNFALMLCGLPLSNPAEVLASNRFMLLLKQWRDTFDYVVIKAGPLLTVSDSIPMMTAMDAVVIVTKQSSTPVTSLQQAGDLLRRTNASVAGIIINNATVGMKQYGRNNSYGKEAYAS